MIIILQKIPDDVKTLLISLVEKLNTFGYVSKIVLFGSYSKGTFNKSSDLDIAVFIDNQTSSIRDVFIELSKVCSHYDFDIQLQVFYEAELTQPIGIIEEVLNYGIDITKLA